MINCCKTGTCKNCVCVKSGRSCTKCLPAGLNRCVNQSSSNPIPPQASSLTPHSSSQSIPQIGQASSQVDPLPQWSSIFKNHTTTLLHVPKSARNVWADLIVDILSTINMDFSDLDSWRKLFMLPRCILANPVNGKHINWRESVIR